MITHSLFSIPSDPDQLIVSSHCLTRFLQRFRLHMTLTETQSKKMQIRLIKKLVMGGYVQRKYEFSPFYVNKQSSKHKHGDASYVKTKSGIFILKPSAEDPTKMMILTVVRHMGEI